MSSVRFTSEKKIRAKVLTAFEKHRYAIAALLPRSEIQHVGSTAIPGALTKGDLDILVRVTKAQFSKAESTLEADPPLGIQLTVRGCVTDVFIKFRNALLKSPTLVADYNQLKLQCEGRNMTSYRQKKSKFIEQVLADVRC